MSLCCCGCGRTAPVAKRTRRGLVAGQPARFLPGHGRRVATDAARFAAFLVADPATGCINFTGHLHRGYGQFGVGSKDDGTRRLVYAHRYAWELAGREIPEDRPHVLHNCPAGDNPACCNVEHLFVGTNADNRADMAKKGRGRRGSLPPGVARNHARFFARFTAGGVHHYLGTFDTPEEAHAAWRRAKEGHYGV